jgi:hypothetical protein
MSHDFSPHAVRLLLEALDQDELPFVTVGSNSMAPLLRRGDQVQLSPTSVDSVAIGDIIVLGEPDDLLAHRFWGIEDRVEGGYLLSRGDRLAYYDPLTSPSQLHAVVVARRRSGSLLDLRSGPGAWLNQTLTKLAHLEAWLMRLPLPPSAVEPGPAATYGFTRRVARRSLLELATLLTVLVGSWQRRAQSSNHR